MNERRMQSGEGGSGAWETWAPSSPAGRVRAVLGVEPGERPLCPEFGWSAHSMGELSSDSRRAVAAVLAEDALRRWAPDLAVERVDVLESRASEFVIEVSCPEERFRVRIPRISGAARAAERERETGEAFGTDRR